MLNGILVRDQIHELLEQVAASPTNSEDICRDVTPPVREVFPEALQTQHNIHATSNVEDDGKANH